jgi:hypothetical protein
LADAGGLMWFCRVESPIQISHKLVFELYFSVYGEDVEGRPLPMGGAGGIRVLIASKGVQIANVGWVCLFILKNQADVRVG